MTITANIVDVLNGKCFYGECLVQEGLVQKIVEKGEERVDEPYLMPGFVDAHVHIESSMLVPTEFARLAVRHGTVATVSDPHEIANVLGEEGVEYMIENAAQTPLKFYFGVPSCVPATVYETAGDTLDSNAVRRLLARKELCYLAEMMNYPGVLSADPEVMRKIAAAKELNKPIDGHAPGLTGDDAIAYITAGITTDHECVSYAEALHKLKHGMKIIIREGSAAKNFEALHPLISEYPDRVMLCSDDKHPDDLVAGHINQLVARAISKGHRWQDVLRAACVNPVLHYGLEVGLLREGDPADMILVQNMKSFEVIATYVYGNCCFENNRSFLKPVPVPIRNRFDTNPIVKTQLQVAAAGTGMIRVIKAIDGALITEEGHFNIPVLKDYYQADVSQDVLKIIVVNRYRSALPAVAFIHGFGIKSGAIASSVAHDSHNIVAVGVDDISLAEVINMVIESKGGVAAVKEGHQKLLPLPIAGIMSDALGDAVAAFYTEIDRFVKEEMGSVLRAPFMTLSFMALLVIPQLKLSDLGLFDGKTFRFADLKVD